MAEVRSSRPFSLILLVFFSFFFLFPENSIAQEERNLIVSFEDVSPAIRSSLGMLGVVTPLTHNIASQERGLQQARRRIREANNDGTRFQARPEAQVGRSESLRLALRAAQDSVNRAEVIRARAGGTGAPEPAPLILKVALRSYVRDDQAARFLESIPGLRYFHREGTVELRNFPNDPHTMHGPEMMGVVPVWQQLFQGEEYASVDFSSVTVAVIDSGMDVYHEDLQANRWENAGGECGPDAKLGVDDDGNGCTDDCYGASTIQAGSCTGHTTDYHSHGTHVAGTIAAQMHNSLGVAGMAGGTPDRLGAKILPIKVLVYDPIERDWDIAAGSFIPAIEYAVYNNADIINLSIGGSTEEGSWYEGMEDILNWARSRGVMIVASAGNEGQEIGDGEIDIVPAEYDAPIVVGAVDSDGIRMNFGEDGASNYGSGVDIWAPGVDIMSTLPSPVGSPTSNRYGTMSGTSMAAPHVSGALALLLALEPGLTQPQALERLRGATMDLSADNPEITPDQGLLNVGELIDLSSGDPIDLDSEVSGFVRTNSVIPGSPLVTLNGAEIVITSVSDPGTTFSAQSGEEGVNGYFGFDIPAGEYTIQASHPEYSFENTTHPDGRFFAEGGQSVYVEFFATREAGDPDPNPDPDPIELVSEVAGHVLTDSVVPGSPPVVVNGVQIVVTDPNDPEITFTTATEGRGFFSLDIPAGAFLIEATHPEYEIVSTSHPAGRFVVEERQSVYVEFFAVPRGDIGDPDPGNEVFNISGTVYYGESGGPAGRGRTVRILDAVTGRDVADTTVTARNGSFSFSDIPRGRYTVMANESRADAVTIFVPTSSEIEIVLPPLVVETPQPMYPAPPDQLQLVVRENTEIEVRWRRSDGAPYYAVFRYYETEAGNLTNPQLVKITSARRFTDTGLQSNILYHYYVIAVNPMATPQMSENSATVSVRTNRPQPRENVQIHSREHLLLFRWQNPVPSGTEMDNAVEVKGFCSFDGGPTHRVFEAAPYERFYFLELPSNTTRSSCYLRASNGVGNSARSATIWNPPPRW